MTRLAIYQNNHSAPIFISQQNSVIKKQLETIGVLLEQWPEKAVSDNSTSDEIQAIYHEEINELKSRMHFNQIDVVHLRQDPVDPNLRQRFLEEHIHTDFEIRYFIAGAGLFYLHVENKVYGLTCTAGDLISVPQNMKHWFDAGNPAHFSCIRFFKREDGWIAEYTKDAIAQGYPKRESPLPSHIKAVVTDIEGTLAPVDFVKRTLFPYAAKHLPGYLRQHHESHIALMHDIRQHMQSPNGSIEEIISQCLIWIATDQKITPLKTLQGYIWAAGYESAEFKTPIYLDVVEALNEWWNAGLLLACYSSGSIDAQSLLYQYSDHGDLREYFSHLFDTTSGPKKEKASYEHIAAKLKMNPESILFLSDDYDELVAASAAGWVTCQIERPNHHNKKFHVQAESFLSIESALTINKG